MSLRRWLYRLMYRQFLTHRRVSWEPLLPGTEPTTATVLIGRNGFGTRFSMQCYTRVDPDLWYLDRAEPGKLSHTLVFTGTREECMARAERKYW